MTEESIINTHQKNIEELEINILARRNKRSPIYIQKATTSDHENSPKVRDYVSVMPFFRNIPQINNFPNELKRAELESHRNYFLWDCNIFNFILFR